MNFREGKVSMPFSFKPLWVRLAQEDMTKEQLRVALGFSSATIAKMGKGEYVSMEALDKICSYFGCTPNDVIEHKREGADVKIKDDDQL
jgi:DNA-binding Xre family transcriptional regulator